MSYRDRLDPPTRRWLSVALLLLCIVFVRQLGLLLTIPPWQGPDELAHFDLVGKLVDERRLPTLYDGFISTRVQALRDPADFDRFQAVRPTDEAIFAAVDRMPLADPSAEVNWITQHPPAYYLALAPAYQLTAGLGIRTQIWSMRLVSSLMGLAVVSLVIAAGWRVFGPAPGVAAGAVVAFHPMVSFLFATINNDIGATLAGTAALAILLVRWQRPPGVLEGLALAAVCGLGLLTKATFLPFIPIVAAALLWRGWRHRSWRSVVAVGVFGAGVAVLAGWWFVRNLLIYQRLFPLSTELLDYGFTPGTLDPWRFIVELRFAELYFQRFWDVTSWIRFPYPDAVYWLIAGMVVVALAGWLRLLLRRPDWMPRLDGRALLLWATLVIYSGALIYQLYELTRQRSVLAAQHGRYLFPVLLPVALIIAAGWLAWLPPRTQRPALALLVVLGCGIDLLVFGSLVLPGYYRG